MPRNLSPEHYQGIGEVVVVWAKLEAHKEALMIDRLPEDFKHFFSVRFPSVPISVGHFASLQLE